MDPIRVAADASAYGIKAVLSQVLNDGSEHPIAYASRSLSQNEINICSGRKGGSSPSFCC